MRRSLAPLAVLPLLPLALRAPFPSAHAAQDAEGVPTELPAREVDEHPHGVRHVSADAKGRVLYTASVSSDGRTSEVHAWDLRKDERRWSVPVDKVPIVDLDVGDEHVVVTLGFSGFVGLEAETGEEVARHGAPDPSSSTSIACDPRDRWVWVGTSRGAARLDMQDIQAYSLRGVEGGGVGCIALDPRGDLLALGCADGGVRFVNAKSANVDDEVLEGHAGPVTALAFVRNARTVVSGGEDGTVRVWDVRSGREEARFELGAEVTALAVDAKGKRLAAGTADGGLALWSVPKGEPLARVETATSGALSGLVFLDDELAGAGGGTSVVLWDVSDL